MNSITNNATRIATTMFAVCALLVVGAAFAPKAHAADLIDSGWIDTGYYDTAPASYDYGGSGWIDTGYYDTAPASYDYGSGSSYFGGSGFGGGGFGYSGMGFGGGSGGYSSTYAPTTVNTTVSTPTNISTCTAPNSCNTSYDDHSIFNAPTTVTVSGGGSSGGSYPVYVPVYGGGYPVYNTGCSTCSCYGNCGVTPVYPVVRQPYVSLSQAPYTGLDLGPVGTALYWGFLVLWCLVAAYLIVYKRVQTKLVSGLNSFLFGAPATVGTHAKVVMPQKAEAHKAYVAPAAHNDDAIDPFIASQIARNK